MSENKDILTELISISKTVAALPKSPVFTVPDGYFSAFPDEILQKVKSLDEPVQEELQQISPLLAGLSRKSPFKVPDGYFASLEQELLPEKKEPGKLVSMYRPRRIKTLLAAASIVTVLGFFTWFYLINRSESNVPAQNTVNVTAELPRLTESEINSYLSATPEIFMAEPLSLAEVGEADFEAIMKDINDAELQEFINENPALRIEDLN